MNPAETLLKVLIDAAEGTRKEGFGVGGVNYTLDQANDRLTGSFIIPVQMRTDAKTGSLVIAAQDFLNPRTDATT